MAGGGGGAGEKEDLFNALPDDALRLILIRLPSTAAAARTRLVSRRWRDLWNTLPELRFPGVTDLARVSAALRLNAVPVLHHLRIDTSDRARHEIAAVLELAAPRLTGKLCFDITMPENQIQGAEEGDLEEEDDDDDDEEEEEEEGNALEIPCFEKATEITMSLSDLAIRLRPAGVFANLTALRLSNFRLHNQNQRDLGDAVSSEGCPALQEVVLCKTEGFSKLAIRSESLLRVELTLLEGLQQLTIRAPLLRKLFSACRMMTPTADISAPSLETLAWIDSYDQSSVHFGDMPHLQSITSPVILVYGQPNFPIIQHRGIGAFLKNFKAVPCLDLFAYYPHSMVNCEYLLDAITTSMLPDNIDQLCLRLETRGHNFGPCAFHFLRMSSSITELMMFFGDTLKAEVPCSSGCIFYKPQDWETLDISLSFLEKVTIRRMTGAECEICFVKRLLRWTPVLKKIILEFHPSVTISEEVYEKLHSLSSPRFCMEITSISMAPRGHVICSFCSRHPGPKFKIPTVGIKKRKKEEETPFSKTLPGDELEASMADGGGDGDGDDHLSTLPDELLHLILLRLRSTAAAALTSLLSRRWRHLWTTLPWLGFPTVTDLARVSAALRLHAAPVLQHLDVRCHNPATHEIAAVLNMAARRLEGVLVVIAMRGNRNSAAADGIGGVVQIPCFQKATHITIHLGGLGIRLPPSGVFEKLIWLRLDHFRFDSQCDPGDVLSSGRCPSLRYLSLRRAQGLSNLAIRSESLLHVDLYDLGGLQQLTIFAPMLRELAVSRCISLMVTTANITAPALETLMWVDMYNQSSVHFNVMPHLQRITTFVFSIYGETNDYYSFHTAAFLKQFDPVALLQNFKAVHNLELSLFYPERMVSCESLMEAISVLPDIDILSLLLFTRGHTFGPCVFHFLRMCTSIRELKLLYNDILKAEVPCSSDCFCYKPQDWETVDICLHFLQKIAIRMLKGAEFEICFVKRLLKWAPVLKTITLGFDPSVTVSEEVCEELLSLASPGICMEIYLRRDGAKALRSPSANDDILSALPENILRHPRLRHHGVGEPKFGGAIRVPCFRKASLRSFGYLGIRLPPFGVFEKLIRDWDSLRVGVRLPGPLESAKRHRHHHQGSS
uniref:F-box domain-containing protein n=1 Tax=Leersia perrieri TaxID=77586 RepID=A0A0D9WWY3_9ORYZ